MVEKPVWFVEIEIPLELMDDIKEGSIDIADKTIDLDEIEDAYNKDLDKEGAAEDTNQEQAENMSMPDQQQGMTTPGGPAGF